MGRQGQEGWWGDRSWRDGEGDRDRRDGGETGAGGMVGRQELEGW